MRLKWWSASSRRSSRCRSKCASRCPSKCSWQRRRRWSSTSRLRSGQQVYAQGRDLIVLALVSYGAEVIADGDIHIYAPLRGRAHAGKSGNAAARIYCHCMEAQVLAIAGVFRTTDVALPDGVVGHAAMVRLEWRSARRRAPRLNTTQTSKRERFQHGHKDHRRHVGQGRRRQDHHQRQLCVGPGIARPQDRGHRLRRRPAQPRPDHGLRAARGL